MDNYLKSAALEYNRLSKEAPAVDFAASESVGIGVLCALSMTLSISKIATALERIVAAQEQMAGIAMDRMLNEGIYVGEVYHAKDQK